MDPSIPSNKVDSHSADLKSQVRSESTTEEESFKKTFFSQHKVLLLIACGFIALLLVFAGVLFFTGGSLVPQQKDTQHIKVRLGWVHQGQFAGFYVAKEKGFYEELGLSVELLPLDVNQNQIEELNAQTVEVSVMEAHQLLAGIDIGARVSAVAVVYKVNPHVLAVREDSQIFGPEDFDGKVVGLSGGEGEGNSLFRLFIDEFGEGEVEYKNLGFNTVRDFENNTADIIDVYSIDQPFLAEQRGIPLRTIPLDAYGLSTYGDVVVVHNNLIETQPDAVRDFLVATFKGWEYAFMHPTEAVEIVLQFAEGGYQDRAYQEHILFESIPLVRGDEGELGRMDLVPWSTLYESMRRGGALKNILNVQSVYTNEFLR